MVLTHINCCCPDCTTTRRLMVLNTHPIHKTRDEDPAPCLIPAEQALAMRLEERDELVGRMAQLDLEIKHLRDC
jgi:hypothetical protein